MIKFIYIHNFIKKSKMFQKGNQINKGRTPWNKGLTKETDERIKDAAKKNMGNKYNLGHRHTKESKINMGEMLKEQYKSGKRKLSSNIFKEGHKVPQKCIEVLKQYQKENPHGGNWKGGKLIYFRKLSRKVAKQKGLDIKGKVIHHIDRNIANNNLSNLQVMTRSEHSKFHYGNGDYPKFSNKWEVI